MRSPIRMAIVGCGGISGAHVSAIESLPTTELVAAVDLDPATRQRVAEEWNIPAFESIGQMLAAMDVEGACVCTPPSTHLALVTELLENGIHVLCEKPLAPSAWEAQAMVDLANQHELVLEVSSKFRHVNDIAEARTLIDDGAIGRPLFYEVQFCATVKMKERWNVRTELAGGGVLMDNGCHAFDVLDQLLVSPIARLTAAFSQRVVTEAVEDTAEILLQTEAGSLVRVALSWSYFTKDLDFVTVQGTEGCVRVGWTGGQVRRHGEREWTSFGTGYDKIAAFEGLLGAFVSSVEEGRGGEPATPGVASVALIEQAYGAASQGCWSEVRSTVV